MAGVVAVLPPRTGCMNGKLEVQTQRFITVDELRTHLPSARAFLDEVTKKGRRYLFIDGFGEVLMEVDIEAAEYKWQTSEHPRGGFAYSLSMDFGRRLPKVRLKEIVNVDRFIVNICSKDYPRGVTVDLIKSEVTYVHDCLWVTKGKGCAAEAKDVLKILKWLVEDKKFKLAADGGKRRYQQLVALLGGK
ncbi:MAG: hypothetical protein Q8O16_00870 [Dehalococcoidia bacterium]|nr:hypothetical protein [Dehalococcoidia bacterium]